MMKRKKALLETPNRRMRKRRRIMQRLLLMLFCLTLVLVGIFYFFRIPALQISKVVVNGANKVDQSMLLNETEQLSQGYVAYLIPRRFFLLYPKKQIASALLSHHQEISAAKVSLHGINKIEITITERSPFAFYCTVSCYIADEKGLVYEAASSTNNHVIFYDKRLSDQSISLVGTHPLQTETFKDVERFAKKLSELKLHLLEIIIEENDDLTVLTEEGRLIISSHESLDGQFEFLKTALSQKMFVYPDGAIRSFNYIDLRFGKKIFYKLERQPEAPMQATTTLDVE